MTTVNLISPRGLPGSYKTKGGPLGTIRSPDLPAQAGRIVRLLGPVAPEAHRAAVADDAADADRRL